MVASSLRRITWACALLFRSIAPTIAADPTKDNVVDIQDTLFEAQHNATLQQEVNPLFGFENAHGRGQAKNPLFGVNLFKRAECEFTESGKTYTCATAGDICCTEGGEGWCCSSTNGCGSISGSCSFEVSWTTTTEWSTSYTTVYRTYTSTLRGDDGPRTRTTTSYTTVSSEMETATEWSTLTITTGSPTLRAGKREVVARTAPSPPVVLATASPSLTSSLPTATPTATAAKHGPQEVLHPNLNLGLTKAPKYLSIRGHLIPRQDLRTDTSETTVTSTTYSTTTSETTIWDSSAASSTVWVTETVTRTAALNARTTVTSVTTMYLGPGETAPPESESLGGGGGEGSGISGRKKGLGGAARAGIGIGVSLALAAIIALVGFLIRKHKRKKEAAATGALDTQPTPEFKPPMQSPVGPPGTMSPPLGADPRYSAVSMPYGAPPPPNSGPVYAAYQPQPQQQQQQQYSSPGQSPPPLMQQYPHEMGGSPPPQMQQYAQQAQYQYPRPPSPMLGGGRQPGSMHGGMQMGQAPSEMPTVYSPHPHRPG